MEEDLEKEKNSNQQALPKRSNKAKIVTVSLVILCLILLTTSIYLLNNHPKQKEIPEINDLKTCKEAAAIMKEMVGDSCEVRNLVDIQRQLIEKGQGLNDLSKEDLEKCYLSFEELEKYKRDKCGESRLNEANEVLFKEMTTQISNELHEGTNCLDAVSQVSIKDTGYTKLNPEENSFTLQIGRGAKEFNLSGVQVIISQGGTTESIIWRPELGINQEVTKTFTNEGSSKIEYGSIEKVEIAPMIQDKETQKTCEISSVFAF